jgi:hypothetical protein
VIWVALQISYEQQKIMIQSKADHEWTHLHLQDYKSIWDYNHVVHKICAMNKHMKNKSKRTKYRERHKFHKTIKWHKFGDYNHTANSAIFSHHLVDLYQKSLKYVGKAKRSYEAYFNDNPKRLQLWERSLPKLRCQTWWSQTTWTWWTWSLNIIQIMCLKP